MTHWLVRVSRLGLDRLQTIAHSQLGGGLERTVNRSVNFQPALVHLSRFQHKFQLAEDRIHRPVILRRGFDARHGKKRTGSGFVVLESRDKPQIAHAAEHGIPLAQGALRIVEG